MWGGVFKSTCSNGQRHVGCWGALLMLLAAAGAYAQSSIPRQDMWVTNGSVWATAEAGGVLYLGGGFTQVGPYTGGFVAIDSGTGTASATWPKVNGYLEACVPDGAGGFYIGGGFTGVGGIARNNIARILADGTVDPAFNANANNGVRSLAVSGSTLYAAGYFSSIGGQPRNHIAALDSTTGAATSWNPNSNGYVYSLAISGGTVYAGGQFGSIGGQARNYIAGLDSTTGAATGWNPNASNRVHSLIVSGSTVYAGGDFVIIGGQNRAFVAALNTTTGAATTWNPNPNNFVSALAVSGSTVFVGGGFSSIGGQTRNSIAALNVTTGAATGWNPNASNRVHSLIVSGSTVYAGGSFSSIGGQSRNNIAALDITTGAATSWNPNANNAVYSLAVSSSTVYAGGFFSSLGGLPRNNAAALDITTGAATNWNPNANDFIFSLAVSGSTVYAGGQFTSIGGQTRNYIAALNNTTGAATTWNPNAQIYVDCLVVSGSTIYAGGAFSSIGGLTRNYIAALNNTTGAATTWNPNANGRVRSLAVSGSTVYAGGEFNSIGGLTRNGVGALNNTTGAATTWNPNANSTVETLAVSGSTVYVGGSFTSIGGLTRNGVAALNNTTGAATTWNPNANSTVETLAVSGSTVYAGGSFTSIGGQTRNRIAALNNTTGAATAWNPNASSDVLSISASSSAVYAGGYFLGFGLGGPSRVAAFTFAPNPPSNPGGSSPSPSQITWIWSDESDNETGFKVYTDPGSAAPTTLRGTEPADAQSWLQSGLTPNTQYSFQVSATNALGDSPKTSQISVRTLAAAPLAPTLSAPSLTTINIAISAGDTNPTGTQYALQHVDSGLYVQSSGALAASPVFRQSSAWATTTVTGLASGGAHGFVARARNSGDLIETANSPAATLHTLAAVPLAPVVGNPTGTSLEVAIATGDGNAASVAYSLREVNSGLYVQASGALGGAPVFQAAAAWSTVTVGGLAGETEYGFVARARNGALVETADSPMATGTTLDATAPDVISITPATTGPTNADSVDFTVVFDEDVLSFDDAADLIVAHSGTAHGGVAVAGGPLSYTVSISGITGDGSFTLAVNTASDIVDLVGNPLASSVTSAAVLIDNTPPGVALASTAGAFVNGGIDVSLTLSEGGTDFQSGDWLLTNAAVSGFAGAGQDFTLTLTGLLDGAFGMAIPAGVFADPAGNANLASNDLTRTLDTTPPSFSGITASPAVASAGEEVLITFEVSEALIAPAEVAVNGNPANDVAKAPQSYTYLVQQTDPFGPAGIAIAGIDLAGNPGMATSTDTLTIESPEVPLPMGGAALLVAASLALLGAAAGRRSR